MSASQSAPVPQLLQANRTYAYEAYGLTAPELVTVFRVEHITRHPQTGARTAFGWIRAGESEEWHPWAEPQGDEAAFTDITPAERGEKDTRGNIAPHEGASTHHKPCEYPDLLPCRCEERPRSLPDADRDLANRRARVVAYIVSARWARARMATGREL